MSIDLTGAQDAITAAFQTRTVRTVGRETNVSSLCGLRPGGGRIERGASGRDQERGDYTQTLPALTTVELLPDEEVTIDEVTGRVFVVVWTPPPGNLNLARRYGLSEVR